MTQINFGGLTFGKKPVIKSIQYGTFFLDSSTSDTETINSVNTANSMLFYLGMSASSHTPVTEWADLMVKIVLTNSTTVTCDRIENPSSMYVSFCVIEFYPGIVKSNQSGTITIADSDGLSNTDTITAVDTSKSICIYLGNTTTYESSDLDFVGTAISSIELLNSTTVKAERGLSGAGADIVASYQVIEFY